MKSILLSLFIGLFLAGGALAANLRISQIDNSNLLLSQEVQLYLSITDAQGEPIKGVDAADLKVFEGVSSKSLNPLGAPVDFRKASNFEDGVRFLLLVDNSGSMYRNLAGKATKQAKQQRIQIAKEGVKSFLNSVSNPKDRFGLVAYNSFYQLLSPVGRDKAQLLGQLEKLEKPTGDAVYTELYSSIRLTAQDFMSHRGRKALIVLSDGENSPYFQNTKKAHPRFGKERIAWQGALEQLQLEGISLYAIAFGPKGAKHDRYLRQIALQSGGAVFDANNEAELKQVYQKILRQILGEYRLTYQAGMGLEDKKYVKAQLGKGKNKSMSTRFYYSGGLLGQPQGYSFLLTGLAAILSLLGFWGLTKVRFEKNYPKPHLEILNDGGAQVSTQILDLSQGQTIIGGAADAGMTIIGGPEVADHHATIVFDPKSEQYTIAAQGALTVNNQPVQTKVLESGDLIRIGATTMIFGQEDEEK